MSSFVDKIIFSFNYGVYLICLSPLIIAYSTISSCYDLAIKNNRYPDWVITPWISFTGVNKPESNYYAIGLTFAGLLLIIVNYIFTQKLMNNKYIININDIYFKHLGIDKIAPYILKYNLIIASIAVTIQAWINVDNTMLMEFLSPKLQKMKWFNSWDAIIHIGSAAIFFFGFIFWHNIFIIISFKYKTISKNGYKLKYSYYYKLFMLIIQYFSGLFLFWDMIFVCYIIDPYKYQYIFQFGVNLIGLCQMICTASYCLFWISFGFDYYVATSLTHNDKIK